MKKATLIITAITLFLGACTKNYYSDSDNSGTSFHINGLSDVTISQDNPARTQYLEVTYVGTLQENVTLSVEDAPAGLYTKLYTPSGYPTFTSQLYFYDSSAAVGTYKVNLVAVGKVTGRRVLPFTVTVEPVPECASPLAGNWSAYNACSGSTAFNENITLSTLKTNRILLDNFENSGASVYADVVCSSRTVRIPAQVVNGQTYSGNGYFNLSPGSSYLNISYTRSGSGGTRSCQETLSR